MELKLEEIGLTKGEIKIYLALAEHGALGKSALSVKAGISSSKIYEIAERLVKKGLVGQMQRDRKRVYQVNDPQRLMNYIEEREKKIQAEKEIVRKAIPFIHRLKEKNKEYRFEIMEGNEGLKQSVNELFLGMKDNEEICGLGIEMKNISLLHDYHKKRTTKNIRQRFIFSNKDIRWTGYKGKQNRFIPAITNIGIGITRDKIILASLGKEPVTLIIEHPEFNKSFRQIFEKLWDVAEK